MRHGSIVQMVSNGQEVSSSDGTNYGSEFSIVSSVQRDFALSYNSALKNTLVAYEISDTPHYTTIGGPSFQGTIGTTFTLPGSGFGAKKGRVLIGKASAKVIRPAW